MTDSNSFFLDTDSEQLAKIHAWARARYAAPWAVFGGVLLRVAASVGPQVQLPGIIGGRASLNMMVAFVSRSGGGKGTSDKVARLAWPTPLIERPIGSGEGIAATFKRPDKADADDEPITAAIFNVPEIDTLAGLAARQGSILLAQLKSMAMGEQLGQSNASKVTSRVVEAHSYRCCLSVGAQPGHTGVIFDDTTGGTPQRFLWFPTTDPDMPAEAAPDPAPLDTTLPSWQPEHDGVVEITYGPDEIAQTVISAHLARQRGDDDALDGHAMLTRLKVAALLAIMHHRSVVSDWDWQRAAEVMAVSDKTREWIVEQARQAVRAKVRDRAIARAVGEDYYDASRLETVRRSLLRMLERDGEQAGGDLRRRLGKREKRELFDQAVALLESEELVVSRPGEHNSVRYRLGSPVTSEVTPQNTRSDGVTSEVTRDHLATVSDLENRRSNDRHRPVPRQTHEEFMRNWIRDNAGPDGWIQPAELFAAGEALGYTRSAFREARRRCSHPRIESTNTGPSSMWRIADEDEGVGA